MAGYWEWRTSAVAALETTRRRLAVLSQQSGRFSSSAQSVSQVGQTRYSAARTTRFWIDLRNSEANFRNSERRLTLLGYDAEVALSRPYFRRLVDQSGATKDIIEHFSSDSSFSAAVDLIFENDAPCANGVPLNPDRVGVVITMTAPDRQYKILTELAFHYSLDGAQFFPTRSAEVCPTGNPNWPELLEIKRRVDAFLWDRNNWPTRQIDVVKSPMGAWMPYMETVGSNVSLFSKSSRGRHAAFSQLSTVPSGYDVSFSASISIVTEGVNAGISKQNESSTFKVPWHNMSGKLVSGPTLIPPSAIEFIVGVYRKDEGGDIPATEWYVNSSGKVKLSATFVGDGGGGGHLQVSQIGNAYDVSGSFTWKYTGVTFGIDSDRMPGFAKSWLDNLVHLHYDSFDPIPLSIPSAIDVGFMVQSDRIVFLARMR